MSAPAFVSLGFLSESEQQQLKECIKRIENTARYNEGRRDFYEAHQKMNDLGIAIPPQLKNTMIAVGWPGLVVDAVDERLDIDRLVMPGGDIRDTGADVIWESNELDLLYPEAHVDALVHGVNFVATSRGVDGQPEQLITIEPPTAMSGIYDSRARDLSAAASIGRNEDGKIVSATLYLRGQAIQIVRQDDSDTWKVAHRDEHGFPRTMVRRMVNRPRGSRQWGRSEITAPIISYSQSAARTLLGAEVAREFYGAPQRWVMGANESDFVDENGHKISPWKSYLGRMLALNTDEETGQVPSVGQFDAASPDPYIALVKMYSQLVAGEAGLPAHYLGFVTENPASADQIRAVEARHVKRVERRQKAFGSTWRGAIIDAMSLRDGEDATEMARRMRVKWRDAGTPTKAAAADRTMKLVASGVLPPDSDVVLEELDFDETDIARIQEDRRRSMGRSLLESIRNGAGAAQQQDPQLNAMVSRRVPAPVTPPEGA